jgi:hypothetical protein
VRGEQRVVSGVTDLPLTSHDSLLTFFLRPRLRLGVFACLVRLDEFASTVNVSGRDLEFDLHPYQSRQLGLIDAFDEATYSLGSERVLDDFRLHGVSHGVNSDQIVGIHSIRLSRIGQTLIITFPSFSPLPAIPQRLAQVFFRIRSYQLALQATMSYSIDAERITSHGSSLRFCQ